MEYEIFENEQLCEELYVALSSTKDGEGIVSVNMGGNNFPVVFMHTRMIEIVKPTLKQLSKDTGIKILLVKFTHKEIIEEIDFSN